MKRGHGDVMGTGKNMWGLWVPFLMQLKIKKAVSKKLCQMTLKHTTIGVEILILTIFTSNKLYLIASVKAFNV